MLYSSFGMLALLLHLIINREIFKKGRVNRESLPHLRYFQFLSGLLIYYVSDILWGFLYDGRIIPLVYADTILYFVSMAMCVLLWTRFVISYLDRKNIFSNILALSGWIIFIYVIVIIIVNFFYPIMFVFGPDGEYAPAHSRYIILGVQFLLYLSTSIYTLAIAAGSDDKEKIHNRTVGLSGVVMTIFIILQDVYPLLPCYAVGCLIGTCLIHVYVEEDEKIDHDRELNDIKQNAQHHRHELEIYNQIADSLALDYDAIYYINIETGKYREFSPSETYESMNVPKQFEDFYSETRANARRYAHPDDRDFAEGMYYKETMLKNLEGRRAYSYKYRIMVNGESRFFRFSLMKTADGRHFVLCEKDIHDVVTAETARLENQKKHITFGQIAETLASNYDVIYYVDTTDGSYSGFTSNNIFGQLEVNREGDDFFEESKKNLMSIIHPQDRERILGVVDKDYLLSMLEERKQLDVDYRLIVDNRPKYTRMSVRRSTDREHLIVVVENIDEEIRKEREHLNALKTEKELARRDELTGTKNKTAYTEFENSMQNNIDNGLEYQPFAITVCDINDLKKVNDKDGHKAGDELIRTAAKLLCNTFVHSPVFRIGGDEFVIFLSGDDYINRKELVGELRRVVFDNQAAGSGPVVAVGVSGYDPGYDSTVSEVFERADYMMYEDKRRLKALPTGND